MARVPPTDPWAIALANRGLLVDFLRRYLPWALHPQLVDDAVQIGLLLLYRAATSHDPSRKSFAGWALCVLRSQLLHRVREFQGLAGADKPISLDSPDSPLEPSVDDRLRVRDELAFARDAAVAHSRLVRSSSSARATFARRSPSRPKLVELASTGDPRCAPLPS